MLRECYESWDERLGWQDSYTSLNINIILPQPPNESYLRRKLPISVPKLEGKTNTPKEIEVKKDPMDPDMDIEYKNDDYHEYDVHEKDDVEDRDW